MKQYGDITKLNGAELDPVDLIVGGSPCQDLSVAGNRAGLNGERSGLFMEMIRIIREMREKTNGVYPRFALWENVPGAFSSNNGRDFSAVLGEFARINEPNAPDVPVPSEGWPKSGLLLVGDGTIAYRTHDAQYWGVPQRRRRIALVADFRGQSAPEILFERKGVSWDSEPGETQGQGTAGTSADRSGAASNEDALIVQNDQGGTEMNVTEGYTHALRAQMKHHEPIILSFQERAGKPGGGKGTANYTENTAPTLAGDSHGTPHAVAVFDPSVHHGYKEFDEVAETVRSRYGTGGNNQPLIVSAGKTAVSVGNGQMNSIAMSDKANALDTMHDQQAIMVYGQSSYGNYAEGTGSPKASGGDLGGGSENMVVGAKCADDRKGPNRQYVDDGKCQITNNTVRRLTPLECERLQGFPDGWTDIPGASDSARYKALGNSIALPFWEYLARRFVEMGGVKTIGSLFDGIGGFPLCFQRAGAETLWTSEIDPFCQKVVEYHHERGEL